jgi:phosphoribosylanthranilate isomerase
MQSSVKIKVCGLNNAINIRKVAALDVDMLGYIFYPGSSRVMKNNSIPSVNKVSTGVFVNESAEKIIETADKYSLDVIQLHGNESPQLCSYIRRRCRVIKSFGVNENFDFKKLKEYEDSCDLFLFDTATENHGGSGKTFSWTLLRKYEMNKPYILSGGIASDMAGLIKEFSDDRLYAIDLNSRFEKSPGIKDINKLKAFIDDLRN